MMKKTILLAATTSLLSGCGGSPGDDRREETVGSDIAAGYQQQLQRAEDVQLELESGKRDLDAAIEGSAQDRRNP